MIASLLIMASLPAVAETITCDQDAAGSLPSGWTAGVTGRGTPKWAIETDAAAPSPPNVLKQSGTGTLPWCVKNGTPLTDGVVEVKFKPVSGKQDQAGGLMWRWKDGDNYYYRQRRWPPVAAGRRWCCTSRRRWRADAPARNPMRMLCRPHEKSLDRVRRRRTGRPRAGCFASAQSRDRRRGR